MRWCSILRKYPIITFNNSFCIRKQLLMQMSAIVFFVNFDTIAIYKKGLLTPYHEIALDTITFFDIWFVNLVGRIACRFLFWFESHHSYVVFSSARSFKYFFFSLFSVLMTDWFLFVWRFFWVLNAYGAALLVSKPALSNPCFLPKKQS